MKTFTRIMALVLACMMLLALVACNDTTSTTAPDTDNTTTAPNTDDTTAPDTDNTTEPNETEPVQTLEEKVLAFMAEMQSATAPGLNTYESSWDDMVAYLTEKGVISAEAEQVDMLTTTGYLKKYDGTFEETYAFADKAVDFGGVYLCWWNLVETTDAYTCYTGMIQNVGNIVVNGGMYVVPVVFANYGSFAIGFAEDYDETKSDESKAVMAAIDGTAYSLKYMSGTTDLAMAMMKQGLLAATDIASGVDLNTSYSYTCQRKDWVGYDESETGYSDPYDTTDNAYVASKAYTFGKVTILYFAPADVAENSYYSYYVSIWNQIQEEGAYTPWCRPSVDWNYTPYTVDADGNYDAEGTELVVPVTAVFGQFAIIVNE